MNKIEISNSIDIYSFAVDKYKLFIGPNYELKYSILNILKQFSNKTILSEKQSLSNMNIYIKINDIEIQNKDVEVIFINSYFDIQTDLKLQSKSLTLKYLEALLEDNDELTNDYYTIELLMDNILSNLSEEEDILKFRNNNFTAKYFIKNIIPYLTKEELLINEYDFSLVEKILFQLNLIEKIALKHKEKWFLLIIDIPKINKKIINNILKLSKNCISLIITNDYSYDKNINNLIYCDNNIFDFSNEEQIYLKIINNAPKHIEREELNEIFKEIFYKKAHNKYQYIIDLINS